MKAKGKRRGQIFSADALMALALVIMMTSIVVNTSGDVQGEISNLLGWYERANVAQNMLDVLTNSPGQPANWDEAPDSVKAVGLKSTYGSFLSYGKVTAFTQLIKSNDPTVRGFMRNLSLDHPFLLEMYLGRWIFSINFSWISGGGIPQGYQPFPTCSVQGTSSESLNQPTYIGCSPLTVNGTLSVYSSADVCVVGGVAVSARGSVSFTYTNPSVSFNLSVSGPWYINGSLQIVVPGNVNANGALQILGRGSKDITANNIVIFSNGTQPAIDVPSGSVTVLKNVYIDVNGVWYGGIRGGSNGLTWYRWNGSKWISSTPPIQVVSPGTTLTVDGTSLPQNWKPPQPSPCFSSSEGGIKVSNITASYTYPSNLTQRSVWNSVAYVNGTLTAGGNLTEITGKMNDARWVEYSARMVSVNVKEYPLNLSITGNSSMVLGGVLGYSLPSYATFTVEVPNETGYIIFTAVDGNVPKVLTVWKSYGNDVTASVWEIENGKAVQLAAYVGNQTSVTIPWGALFGSGAGSPVSMWVYKDGFNGTVRLIDNGNIGTLLLPLYDPMMIRLWVWEP